MLDFLVQDPQVTLEESVGHLDSGYDLKVHKSTVSRKLDKLKVT